MLSADLESEGLAGAAVGQALTLALEIIADFGYLILVHLDMSILQRPVASGPFCVSTILKGAPPRRRRPARWPACGTGDVRGWASEPRYPRGVR